MVCVILDSCWNAKKRMEYEVCISGWKVVTCVGAARARV